MKEKEIIYMKKVKEIINNVDLIAVGGAVILEAAVYGTTVLLKKIFVESK